MMKPWKLQLAKLLSLAGEVSIDKKTSKVSGELELSLKGGRWLLNSPHATYSFGDQYRTYRNSFRKLKVNKLETKTCLVLGYGFGSITDLLHKRGIHPEVTGIELDPQILEWLNSYNYKNYVQLIKADALTYNYAELEKPFDLICIDIFIDTQVPAKAYSIELLTKLKSKLSPNGLLLFNQLYHTPLTRNICDKAWNNFQEVFPGAYTIFSSGNCMLVYDNRWNNV